MSNISLIGFMGSGKTSIGKILAEKTCKLFIDLDRIIELNEDATIADIFKTGGEKYFREIESKIIKKVYKNNDCVFACGGGVILRRENMKIIKGMSKIVYLEISPPEALHRLKNSIERPLLKTEDRSKEIIKLLGKRTSLYKKYADLIINNEETSVDTTIKRIMEKI